MSHVASTTSIKDIKKLVNTHLESYCNDRINQAAGHGTGYAMLWQFTSRLLLSGGKRFRPYLFLMTYQAYAKDSSIESVLPAALSQELLHFSMLVHDDIIDRDLVRYGVRNIMGQYEDFYASFISDESERTHMARSGAMLAGDILLSDAYRLVSQTKTIHPRLTKALEIMSHAVFEVVGGELLDTEAAFISDPLINAKSIGLHKTASYSFIAPMTMGAVLAGANEQEVEKLHTIAERLGVGYQLRDDLLGVFGDEAQTGKSNSSDIIEGKRTYLIEQFEKVASVEQQQSFFSIFHNPAASSDKIASARELLVITGAKAAVEEEIAQLKELINHDIDSLKMNASYKQVFYELVTECLMREV